MSVSSLEPLCANCPRTTPAVHYTVAWDPYRGWDVLDSNGRLVASDKIQEKAWRKAERLLNQLCPEGETLVSCSRCPYLKAAASSPG